MSLEVNGYNHYNGKIQNDILHLKGTLQTFSQLKQNINEQYSQRLVELRPLGLENSKYSLIYKIITFQIVATTGLVETKVYK